MTDVVVIEWIQSKYKNLMGDLDERARRRWSAVEALGAALFLLAPGALACPKTAGAGEVGSVEYEENWFFSRRNPTLNLGLQDSPLANGVAVVNVSD